MDTPVRSTDMDELYRRLQPASRRGKAPVEPVAAAVEAVQHLSTEMDVEDAVSDMAKDQSADSATVICSTCSYRNRKGNRFCGKCGSALSGVSGVSASLPAEIERPQGFVAPPTPQPGANESHHYHHHYHHHYFNGATEGAYPRGSADAGREDKIRPTAALRGDMSRAEAAVRRITQEWVLACNTRHLDDLLELYVSDALVMRSNHPPIRGAAAVREFFFGALGAGLGEVEVEPVRVEVAGDLAYEAGRCKALIPSSNGKRREERGKYLWVLAKQPNSEWKLAADCWSSDLTLTTLESDIPANAAVKTAVVRKTP
jgi:ketosteroid isomerase-like protein